MNHYFSNKTFIFIAVFLVMIISGLIVFTNKKEKNNNSSEAGIPTGKIAIGKINQQIQKVHITLDKNGFSPAVLVLQKNVTTLWTIDVKSINAGNNIIVFPATNYKIILTKGKNLYRFTPLQNFIFRSGTGLFNGYGKVVDDIHKINIASIKEEAANIKLPKGSGACCWVR